MCLGHNSVVAAHGAGAKPEPSSISQSNQLAGLIGAAATRFTKPGQAKWWLSPTFFLQLVSLKPAEFDSTTQKHKNPCFTAIDRFTST
jgi:hypothetical protein